MTITAPPNPPVGAAQPASDVRVLSAEEAAWVEHLRQVRADTKTNKTREAEVTKYLKALLVDFKGATFNGRLVLSLGDHDGRATVDMELLKTKYPDAYAECVGHGAPYRTLSLK